jgi:glyoxylase-like metal-dependent hydrolase (beta-lactamase superfamily II)
MAAISVGDAAIMRVEELTHRMPISAFGADPDWLAAQMHWLRPRFLEPDDHWTMVFQSFVVAVDGRIIVVDPCTGNGRPSPGFPLFDNLDIPFLERMAATGVRPEAVDYVICTHLHADHCGWNTQLRDGRFVPTFPNARYLLGRREVDHWNPARPGFVPNPLSGPAIFDASVRPVIEAGLADLVGDSHDVLPGLRIEAAPGHTAGHAVVHLQSAGRHALFTGDCFHHPLELVRPELDMGACEDFAVALATRRRLVAHCLAHDALVVPAHFAAPHVGHLRQDGDGLRFVPLDGAVW